MHRSLPRPRQRARHLPGYTVGLLLVPILGPAFHQLGLYDRRGHQVGRLAGVAHDLLHVTVAVLRLQVKQRPAGTGKPAAAGLVQRRGLGAGTRYAALPEGNAPKRAVLGCLDGLGDGRHGRARRSEPGLGWGWYPRVAPGHPRLPIVGSRAQ